MEFQVEKPRRFEHQQDRRFERIVAALPLPPSIDIEGLFFGRQRPAECALGEAGTEVFQPLRAIRGILLDTRQVVQAAGDEIGYFDRRPGCGLIPLR